MKYLSLDIETTGLDKEKCSIIQFAAVVEDTSNPLPYHELPKFVGYLYNPACHWEVGAMTMNPNLNCYTDLCLKYEKIIKHNMIMGSTRLIKVGLEQRTIGIVDEHYNAMYEPYVLTELFNNFVDRYFDRKIVVAGKNVANFDIPFIKNKFPKITERFSSRVLDPAILFIEENDIYPPSLQECLDRLPDSFKRNKDVKHDAYEDALDVINLFRYQKSKGKFI